MRLGFLVKLLGRNLAWRIGRGLYMEARGEVENSIASNGEAALIRATADAFRGADDGLVFWDVGSNLGEWSETAIAAAGETPLRLEIFEPAPVARAGLEQRLGRRAGVTIHACALSDQQGTGRMAIVGPTAGTNALVAEGAQGDNLIEVPLQTGDLMMASLGLSHVHLIKIDAEGFDLFILKGLKTALAEGRISVVQFEYNGRWLGQGASLLQVFSVIEGLPYRLGRVSPGGIELYDTWNVEMDRYFECNYVLVHRDAAKPFGAREGRWNESNVLVLD